MAPSDPPAFSVDDLMAHPLPRSWFVFPFPRNPDFVGREHELACLHSVLGGADEPVGITPAGLTGMGVIGKMTKALESYIYLFLDLMIRVWRERWWPAPWEVV